VPRGAAHQQQLRFRPQRGGAGGGASGCGASVAAGAV
jgi:hypothetical protein